MLIVAPKGTEKDATDLSTPNLSSTVFKVIGIVAALGAYSLTGQIIPGVF